MSRYLYFTQLAESSTGDRTQELISCAETTLAPFESYLATSIASAKSRHSEGRAEFERVESTLTAVLTPKDTVVHIDRTSLPYLLEGWPLGQQPTSERPRLMVPARDIGDGVVSDWSLTSEGLLVDTDVVLQAGEFVWCQGHQCVVADAPAMQVPSDIRDQDGHALALRLEPKDQGDSWLLVIEDHFEGSALVVDGRAVRARLSDPFSETAYVVDSGGVRHDVGVAKRTTFFVPPGRGELRGDSGVRFTWTSVKGKPRGVRVQLLSPGRHGADDRSDVRDWFFDGEAEMVQTAERSTDDNQKYKILSRDRDVYQLVLDRAPPAGSTLYLPLDTSNLNRQLAAVRQLRYSPLPHHRPLIRLMEDPSKAHWPPPGYRAVSEWRFLTDKTRSGTAEQRSFVERALASPDFSIMEGPPGSGKTHAICELIYQLLKAGKRVLMCGSTHASVDNVLERMLTLEADVDAVRVGRSDSVDDGVVHLTLDNRIDDLVARWRREGVLGALDDKDLRLAAERTVVASANLTCGTTMGITRHPYLRDVDRTSARDDRATSWPHWDVLIVDEASKTRITDFLVPALLATRWVIVGDVHQLPPFGERDELVQNLLQLRAGRTFFTRDHQRACLVVTELLHPNVVSSGAQWCVVGSPAMLDHLEEEVLQRTETPLLARVVAQARRKTDVLQVSLEHIRTGARESLALAAADWVLVQPDDVDLVFEHLPGRFLWTTRPRTGASPSMGHHEWACSAGLDKPFRVRKERIDTRSKLEGLKQKFFVEKDLASEIAWRLTRIHELSGQADSSNRAKYRTAVDGYLPRTLDVGQQVWQLFDIAVPSVLEVLQRGVGEGRGTPTSALAGGLPPTALEPRFTRLTFQHRMHPDIAELPRRIMYRDEALIDANTIAARDEPLGWDFLESELPSRRVWIDVQGTIVSGVNRNEVQQVVELVRQFLRWADSKGLPRRPTPRRWEVACLAFYNAQRIEMSRAITDAMTQAGIEGARQADNRIRFRHSIGNVDIVVATVDRFQGREADLVCLSMRNRFIGFLDSPNRLNVAMTRARQQLVVVGDWNYFHRLGHVPELQSLATGTTRIAPLRGQRK